MGWRRLEGHAARKAATHRPWAAGFQGSLLQPARARPALPANEVGNMLASRRTAGWPLTWIEFTASDLGMMAPQRSCFPPMAGRAVANHA